MSGRFVSGDFVFVSVRKATSLSSNLAYPGDLIFTQRGTLGQVSIAPDNGFERYLISQSQMKVSVNSARHDPLYVFQYFSSHSGQKQITSSAIQTGVPHTNLGILRGYRFPAPPLTEQRAIAEALSDMDALLDGLARLIAKKRALQQAAMQQLLTGQTRLPGFTGEWEVTRLGDLAEIISGGTPSTREPSYWNGGIRWCTPTDITSNAGKYLTDTERTISRDGLSNSGAVMLPAGALLLCSRATIGEVKIAAVPICTNQGFKSLVCRAQVNNEFMYYKLLTMKQQMIERAFGSTFLEISTRNVAALEVVTPAHDEQTAIATVLSDMDAELQALEARRDKTRALKQAMMQALLTGQIRLVPPQAAVSDPP